MPPPLDPPLKTTNLVENVSFKYEIWNKKSMFCHSKPGLWPQIRYFPLKRRLFLKSWTIVSTKMHFLFQKVYRPSLLNFHNQNDKSRWKCVYNLQVRKAGYSSKTDQLCALSIPEICRPTEFSQSKWQIVENVYF